MDEAAYRAAAAHKGYDTPTVKSLEPGTVNESHTHDVALFVYVQQGEFIVDVEADTEFRTKVCLPGDTIEVPGGVVHIERVGHEGTTLLVARK